MYVISIYYSYLAANKDNKLMATVAAFCAMGVAGEIAQKRMSELDGNASFRNYLIDAIYNMTGEQLELWLNMKRDDRDE